MKKRIFLLFMCGALLTAAGCGNSKTDNGTQNNASEGNVTNSTNDSNDDNAGTGNETGTNDSSDSGNSSAPTDNSPITDIGNGTLYSVIPKLHTAYHATEDDISLLYCDYETLQISGDTYPALVAAVAQWQEDTLAELERTESEYIDIAKEDSSASMEEFYGYSLSQTYEIKRLDSHVLSLTEFYDEYTGAAHPLSYKDGINFNAATGELITLDTLVTDYDAFSEAAISYILDSLKHNDLEEDNYYEMYEELVHESFAETPWYFSASGITMIYNTYSIAPYAAGILEITLPYDTFDSYIKEEYRLGTAPGVVSIPVEETTSLTVNTESGSHELTITNGYALENEDSYEDVSPLITLDGSSVTTEQLFFSIMDCYLIYQTDRTLLMMDGTMFSDDYTTVLYDITDGTLKELAAIGASIHMPSANTTALSVRIDALGTYFSTVEYDLSSGNELKMLDSEYFISSATVPLVTTKELPVTNAAGEEIMLPVGTSVLPIVTDTESYIRLSDTATYEEYTVHFNRDNYIIMIDGVEEYEYFEVLPYAG